MRSIWRLTSLIISAIVLALVIGGRLFVLQIINHNFYVALAQDQHELFAELQAKRGEIYVTDKESREPHLLAGNIDLGLLFAVPREIEDKSKTAKILSQEFGLVESEVLAKIDKENDAYEPLAHKLNKTDIEKVKSLNLKGIGVSKEPWRFYPEADFASHILGFVGFAGDEKVGRYGVEGYYNKNLEGRAGFVSEERDAAGAWISVGRREIKAARPGDDLVLESIRVE